MLPAIPTIVIMVIASVLNVLAILSVVFILLMVVLGPLFITCIFWWAAHTVHGIIVCAVGLILILFSNQVILHMIDAQQKELMQGF